jgi:hypothetical protein
MPTPLSLKHTWALNFLIESAIALISRSYRLSFCMDPSMFAAFWNSSKITKMAFEKLNFEQTLKKLGEIN